MTETQPQDSGKEKADAAEDLRADLDQISFTTFSAEEDPALAAQGMTDQELADAIASIQDVRHRLNMVERDLTTALGHRLGKGTGSLSDGRQFKLERSSDRKEWDHDDWKRDVRRAVTTSATERFQIAATENPDGDPEGFLVDAESGEEVSLAQVVQRALTDAQEVHGSTAPRSTALKSLGLYASDYCTSTPGGWRFNAIKPTAPTATEDTTNA